MTLFLCYLIASIIALIGLWNMSVLNEKRFRIGSIITIIGAIGLVLVTIVAMIMEISHVG